MSNLSSINKADISDFEKRVYLALLKVPKGQVVTYGALAKLAGFPGAARAVGSAMNKNPFAPSVACHRVVRSDGSVGEFAYGTKRKIAMLRKEGVRIEKERITDFKEIKIA
ncbi:MGMT family protein [bacterium]|jgi:methylated-DNA-[protein]-cysteine S-methyltransferase|nr:MGMT family protein [bacterium]MBT4597736.1 MGMT family protein [bacterium]MBT6753748.1 MGMT family protein [bacterium]MBT7037885.1 MGMT family protein [bacterium]MBT7431438.1 MGMT family protein [bacterium]